MDGKWKENNILDRLMDRQIGKKIEKEQTKINNEQ